MNYPPEFCNSLEPLVLPPDTLALKFGTLVIETPQSGTAKTLQWVTTSGQGNDVTGDRGYHSFWMFKK